MSFEDTGVLDKLSTASRWEESFSSLSASLLSCSFTLLTSLCSVSQSPSSSLLLFPLLGIETPSDGEESLMTKTQERKWLVYGALLQGSVLYLLRVPGRVTLRLHSGWFRLFSNRVDRQPVSWNLWSVERLGDSWSIQILAVKINIYKKKSLKIATERVTVQLRRKNGLWSPQSLNHYYNCR